MLQTDKGIQAEQAATDWLKAHGYKIVARNWRTPAAEIDVICTKDNATHCVEVRYRSSDNQGGGIGSVSSKKIQQMQTAAVLWAQEAQYQGQISLGVVEVTGVYFTVTRVILPVICY